MLLKGSKSWRCVSKIFIFFILCIDEKDIDYIYIVKTCMESCYPIPGLADILLFPGTWRRISTWTDLAPGTGQP